MNGKFLFCLLWLLPAVISAQDRPIRALTPELVRVWQKHAVRVDGSINPSAIPYGIAMERAFLHFDQERPLGEQAFRQQLRSRFTVTEADVERIGEIASQSSSFSATVRNDASQSYDQLCTEIVGALPDTLNALEVAEKLTAIAANQAERLSAHYREAVAGLSAGTRSALESYVDTEIRPQMRWGHDLIGLATEVPQAFLSLRQKSCELRLNKSTSEKTWRVESIPQVVPPDPE